MQSISWFADRLSVGLGWLVGVFLAASSLAVFCQVVIRFVLPLFDVFVAAPWTEEVSRYLMVWVVFLGVAVLCRSFRLIAVEIVALMVPPAIGKTIKLFSVALCVGFFVIIAQIGFAWMSMSAIELSPVMRLPMNWVYAAMPVGAVVSIFNLLVFAAESVVGDRDILASHAEVED